MLVILKRKSGGGRPGVLLDFQVANAAITNPLQALAVAFNAFGKFFKGRRDTLQRHRLVAIDFRPWRNLGHFNPVLMREDRPPA